MAVIGTNETNVAHPIDNTRAVAEFDFSTDGLTMPTQAMLDAAANATYKDDVLREDPTTESFQAEMAEMTEHEDALFVISATMGNQLAMRCLLTQHPYSVLVDARSHILIYEAGGVSSLTGATMQPVAPRNGKYLTLEDITGTIVLSDMVQLSPTKVICLENTCNGLVMPVEEIRKISTFARQHGIKIHLDATRIFDAVVTGAGRLPDFTREFDTATLCFSKGLGAPMGSILVGSKKTIANARRVRQSIGGGVHQMGILAAMARVALKDTFGNRIDGRGSLLAQSHRNATRIAELWLRSGGKLLGPTETCMVFLDIKEAGLSLTELITLASEHGLHFSRQRLVVHYRNGFLERCKGSALTPFVEISEEAIKRVERLFTAIAAAKGKKQVREQEKL